MLTSNRAEITVDLANRASIVRILHQPQGYHFQESPEGSILDQVRANPAYYLAAVFAVIRAWHAAGRPRSAESRHAFREWETILDWIVQNLLKAAPLLDGAQEAATRMTTPLLNWLRDLCIAVDKANAMGKQLRVHQILSLIQSCRLETAGVDLDADPADGDRWMAMVRAVGRHLASCCSTGPVTIDARFRVERSTVTDGEGRDSHAYTFHDLSHSPNAPQSSPNEDAYFPNPRNHLQTFSSATAGSSGGYRDVGGAFGALRTSPEAGVGSRDDAETASPGAPIGEEPPDEVRYANIPEAEDLADADWGVL